MHIVGFDIASFVLGIIFGNLMGIVLTFIMAYQINKKDNKT